jgi:Tol biopolymer transport system component
MGTLSFSATMTPQTVMMPSPTSTLVLPRIDVSGVVKVPYTDLRMFERTLSPDGNAVVGTVDIGPTIGCPEPNCANYALFVVDVTTGEVHQLTEPPVTPRYPFWSPDSRRIGFYVTQVQVTDTGLETRRGIAVMDVDGTGMHFFAEGDSAAWSSDGRALVVAEGMGAGDNQSFVLRILDATTGQGDVVFQHDGCWDWGQLAWSPDGKHIALAWREYPLGPSRLYVLDLDTMEVIPLSGDVRAVSILGWTSDGKWLAHVLPDGHYFAHWDGTCLVTPSGIENIGWLAFSGQSSKLLVEAAGELYVLNLRKALGPDFPDGVLSCP